MNSDPMYARGKLHAAVSVLVSHPGAIRARLLAACDSGLAVVGEGDMPTVELRDQWRGIFGRVAGLEAAVGQSGFERSIGAMLEDEAVSVAEDLFALYHALDRWARAERPELCS